MDNYEKETIKLKGSTGKPVEMTLDELSKKKITGKVEVVGKMYYVKLTRWYSLDQAFTNLSDAASALIKVMQKLSKLT